MNLLRGRLRVGAKLGVHFSALGNDLYRNRWGHMIQGVGELVEHGFVGVSHMRLWYTTLLPLPKSTNLFKLLMLINS